ncbi:MAG: bifunctional methylenetetrahydrofolate dehydrogenase/methenyltetrahydrofolate cyclohydrolase FolD [Alphaproteobacteria bacterium]|nr:bifunctional methylenetetrahydrofolate dehydrogenase/methenyltetrahydrofolate cyclohydrolase FolD [Alphaproteobacteria bacterium]MCL2505097.1 bifunctional methylenetetrahydrofolate dehydrogenase/methenyltetrahydrofolate cyclohydrolase FolD [Alphaproteobacteria bacterium]
MTHIIDGKEISKVFKQEMAAKIKQNNLSPGLAVILVGQDPASEVYVRNKINSAKEIGINSTTIKMPEETSQQELLSKIKELNEDNNVHGILVQLPLPKHINVQDVIMAISPEKDVDGFHPVNVGNLYAGIEGFVPCTPKACMILLSNVMNDLTGKKALVIGRSNIVGKPVAQLLLQANCTVTLAHSKTVDLVRECETADIIIAAVGIPHFVKGHWIKEGAVVIDVGINRIPNPEDAAKTKLVGDVDFEEAKKRASAITPVPRGVGPMTIACLLANTIDSAIRS